MQNILWTVIGILVLLWVIGLVTSFGGPLIHAILVVAGIILVYNLVTKGKATL